MAFHFAIVEDNPQDRLLLRNYLDRFFRENFRSDSFQVTEFENAGIFLEGYRPDFDLVFLDIQMPGINGMDAASALRQKDGSVLLLFVTNMAQYAVRGYDVNAAGFVLKPVSYYDFLLRMRKCMGILQSRTEKSITLKMRQGIRRLSVRSILYVEVNSHMLSYHTAAETIQATGSLSEMEETLAESGFLRCNSCFLVNPRAISTVIGYDIQLINGDTIQISHPKKKQFMQALNVWLGEGKNL
ncbi:MAG: LytTR family DNA-binding domain-containing protein [Clostridiales bacterium]|nr:LytTR family DNA-binding domain-containing protein [Clostridiales bacterium]